MEIVLIGLVILVVGAVVYFNRSKSFDVNSDGKVDTADVKEAVVKTKAAVKKTATKAKAAAATAAKKPGRKPKTAK